MIVFDDLIRIYITFARFMYGWMFMEIISTNMEHDVDYIHDEKVKWLSPFSEGGLIVRVGN